MGMMLFLDTEVWLHLDDRREVTALEMRDKLRRAYRIPYKTLTTAQVTGALEKLEARGSAQRVVTEWSDTPLWKRPEYAYVSRPRRKRKETA